MYVSRTYIHMYVRCTYERTHVHTYFGMVVHMYMYICTNIHVCAYRLFIFNVQLSSEVNAARLRDVPLYMYILIGSESPLQYMSTITPSLLIIRQESLLVQLSCSAPTISGENIFEGIYSLREILSNNFDLVR